MFGYFGALPKAGSFYTGPEPAAPAGGWPPFKGKVGPRQEKCLALGGRWIGPTGKKWCQLWVETAPVGADTALVYEPSYVTSPLVTAPPVGGAPLQVVGGPSDTAIVPTGEQPGTPAFGPPAGAVDQQAVSDFAAGGQVAMSATAAPTPGVGGLSTTALLVAGGIGVLIFVLMRRGKGAAVSTAPKARRRRR